METHRHNLLIQKDFAERVSHWLCVCVCICLYCINADFCHWSSLKWCVFCILYGMKGAEEAQQVNTIYNELQLIDQETGKKICVEIID